MPKYTFDFDLSATAFVEAESESEARKKLDALLTGLEDRLVTDTIEMTSGYVRDDSEPELVEIDGEAV